MRTRFISSLAVLAMAGSLSAMSALPAAASCLFDERSLDEQIASSDIVFVGVVDAVAHQNTTANFEVQEVWKGTVSADFVAVIGGSGQDGAATSVDRSWSPGTRYLVFPVAEGDEMRDNSCSPTREWTEDLAASRPDDAEVRNNGSDPTVVDVPGDDTAGGESPLQTAGERGDDGASPIVPIAIGAAVLGAGVLGWVRIRSEPRVH